MEVVKLQSVASVHNAKKEKEKGKEKEKEKEGCNWYILTLSYTDAYKVKLMIEESVKILGISECLESFVVLASYKHSGLYCGGLLSGYAIIKCKMTSQLYYLLSSVPSVYGLLKSGTNKNEYLPPDRAVSKLSEEEVSDLIKKMMMQDAGDDWLEVGREVSIKDGPFCGFKGVIVSFKDKKAFLQIEIMGRAVKASIEIENLVKI